MPRTSASVPPRKLITLKRRLQFFTEELEQLCADDAATGIIEAQLGATEELYRRVDLLQEEYEASLDGEDVNTAMAEWAEYRRGFRDITVRARTLISAGKVEIASSQKKGTESERNVRLPSLELPKFGGDFTEFRGFWDRFADSIHKRTDLSDGAKLTYLRGCLTGDALKAIIGLSSSNADYEVAVQRLKERFDRPYIAVRKLVLELTTANTTGWTMERLSDHIDRNVDALTALGKDPRGTEISAAEMLVIGYRERITAASRIEWDKLVKADERLRSDLTAFQRFLRERAEAMAESHGAGRNRDKGTSSESHPSNTTTRKGSLPVRDRRTATFLHATVAEGCRICKGPHKASECQEVLKADRKLRKALACKAGLCFRCFEPGHYANRCGQRGGSVKGGRKGNSPDPPSGGKPSDLPRKEEQKGDSGPRSLNVNLVSFDEEGGTRLQIIRALAHGDGDKQMVVNCMFDTAAERSFIRADVARELGLRGKTLSIAVHGFGGGCRRSQESQWVNFWLSPVGGGPRRPVRALTMEKLCDNIVLSGISIKAWPHLRGLGLPEEEREEELQVHVVLGIDHFFRMMGTTIVRGGEDDPVAVETCLGWVVCGPQPPPQSQTPVVPVGESSNSECDLILRKFWELEAIGIHPESEKAQSDKAREEFERSLSYDGVRYTVRLLWKKAGSVLPNNYKLALKRLGSVQKKLIRDPRRLYEYSAVIRSYLDNGWAEEAPEEGPVGRTWYLPHHAVYQKGSTGDVKCRVVFDGSAQFRGVSLNDLLDPGANLQTDLLGILIRFRRYRIGLQADIQKMYLQVALHEADKDVCRFLWQEPGRDELPKTYRLSRVCFGLTCSPYLAMQTVRLHAERHEAECPGALSDILPNMYVDDLVVSCNSIRDAKRLAREATSLLGKGGFCLAKWASNSPDVVKDVLAGDGEASDGSRLWKTLGILWERGADVLTFRPPEKVVAEIPDTKRGILTLAASVFDPLGCLAPYTVRAKMMIQLLWQEGIAWDDPLPSELRSQWQTWKEELPDLHRIAVNRAVVQVSVEDITRLELHGFADPADLLSRGCSLQRISSETLWWSGPGWLLLAEASWPDIKVKRDQDRAEAEKEGRRSALVMVAVLRWDVRSIIDPTRYSSYVKLLRVTAFCLRFINNARLPAELRRTTRGPTAVEIEEAEAVWIRQIQVDAYGKTDLGSVRMKELKEFCPYVDDKGVLRVGGRLRRANLPSETKHPMLLPHGDDVVRMIIRHVHQRQLHAGVNQTLAASRQRYWITRGRSAVKNVIRQCVTCRRSVGQPFGQKMGELPAERVTPTGPFRHVGVDFAGPILARRPEARHEFVKTYVCVFTCMVVRAIHLELVMDMTVNSFLGALRRFISRRGRPKLIQSDNFRTFRQAGSFLKPLFRSHNWEVVQRTLADEHIEWRFITERAPWCGGYWERLVRSVKVALTKVLGRSRADPEELRTVLCEIEARINDRPLTIRIVLLARPGPAWSASQRRQPQPDPTAPSLEVPKEDGGTPVVSLEARVFGNALSARKVETAPAAAEGRRHSAGDRTESSQEPVGPRKNRSTAERWRRSRSFSPSEDFQGVGYQISAVTDLGGAGRIFVMDRVHRGGRMLETQVSRQNAHEAMALRPQHSRDAAEGMEENSRRKTTPDDVEPHGYQNKGAVRLAEGLWWRRRPMIVTKTMKDQISSDLDRTPAVFTLLI
ncbi:hypothetical protein T10_7670 [Trichinella papuae]|uniref:CCHC-type domain-containing protein n=1 Tax=Trichinella papuae TaxID=268474 RepID=A0A0V1M4Y2_9BILA|nr:hypothetical protein T10_7670 [Trichinella papuae]